jgi:hypothetical protein
VLSRRVNLIKSTRADDDDRDGQRNVGILRTSNAADSPRRLYQIPSDFHVLQLKKVLQLFGLCNIE